MTIPDAAEHFKVSTATIRRWIRSGRVRGQLTLGPFGEQWMVDPVSDEGSRSQADRSAYIPVEQLTSSAPSSPGASSEHQDLLREAEQAVQEAWQARQQAEAEVARLRAQVAETPAAQTSDWLALRCDLEGSERIRLEQQRRISELESECQQAWQETRGALKALSLAYADQERLQQRTYQLETESECLRRALGQRLGLDWREFDLLQLFLRWEALQEGSASDYSVFRTASLEGPSWSGYRRPRTELERKSAT